MNDQNTSLLDSLPHAQRKKAYRILGRIDKCLGKGISAAANVRKFLMRDIKQVVQTSAKYPDYPDFESDIEQSLAEADLRLKTVQKEARKKSMAKKKGKKRPNSKGYNQTKSDCLLHGRPFQGGAPQ